MWVNIQRITGAAYSANVVWSDLAKDPIPYAESVNADILRQLHTTAPNCKTFPRSSTTCTIVAGNFFALPGTFQDGFLVLIDHVRDKPGCNFHLCRLKHGVPSTHPLTTTGIRALRRLENHIPDAAYVFLSERKGPLTDPSVRKMITRAGEVAELGFPVHPHHLRHGCGYKLANDKQDTRAIQLFLGHKNMQHTVKYTELSAERFKDFWKDELFHTRRESLASSEEQPIRICILAALSD
jgi:hypothetical protein